MPLPWFAIVILSFSLALFAAGVLLDVDRVSQIYGGLSMGLMGGFMEGAEWRKRASQKEGQADG